MEDSVDTAEGMLTVVTSQEVVYLYKQTSESNLLVTCT